MPFLKRLAGIFSNPKPIFQFLAEKPVWVDALIVLLILTAVFSYFVAPFAQQDQLQMMKDNTKFKEKVGEDRYNKMIESMENPNKTGMILRSGIGTPLIGLIGLLFSSLILMIMGRFISSQGRYVQILAALVHASFVDKLLGNAVRLFLILSRKSLLQTTTSLALFFPKMEVTSSAYIVLSQIDIFQLWMFGILAYGLARIFNVNLKKALAVSYGFWLLKSLVVIALGIIGMQYMR